MNVYPSPLILLFAAPELGALARDLAPDSWECDLVASSIQSRQSTEVLDVTL